MNVVRIENDNIAILPVRQGFDAEGEHHDESQKKQITAFSSRFYFCKSSGKTQCMHYDIYYHKTNQEKKNIC